METEAPPKNRYKTRRKKLAKSFSIKSMVTIKWGPSRGLFPNRCTVLFAVGVLTNCQSAHKKAKSSICLKNVDQHMRQGTLGKTLGLPWGA